MYGDDFLHVFNKPAFFLCIYEYVRVRVRVCVCVCICGALHAFAYMWHDPDLGRAVA